MPLQELVEDTGRFIHFCSTLLGAQEGTPAALQAWHGMA